MYGEMHIVTELGKQKLNKSEIVSLGKAISGGFGFWEHSVRRGKKKEKVDRAWIKALRGRGLSDVDIALFGDWSDGRHIGDGLTWDELDTEKKMVDYIKKNSEFRTVTEIRSINRDGYGRSEKLLKWVKKYKPSVLRD